MVVGAGLVTVAGASPAAAADSCPLAALKKAKKPVEITMWHSMPRTNGDTLRALTDTFNASQSDVKVNLVDQVTYEDTFTKYKAGLSSGDLPDVVQLQGEDQQQMIDTRTVLPASACAKADKYSFADFLPRVVSFYTVEGTMYAMPFNTSGPVLFYDKNAFRKAGLDPDKPPTTLDGVRAAAEKLKSSGAVKNAGLGLKVDPGYFQQLHALAGKLFVNNSNGRKARATKAVFNDASGLEIFTWMSDMVKFRPRRDEPPTAAPARSTTSWASGTATTQWRSTRVRRSARSRPCWTSGQYPDLELGVGPMPGPKGNGARERPGRGALHREQVGAGEAGGGVAVLEVPRHAGVAGHVGGRHRLPPDRQEGGGKPAGSRPLGEEPRLQGGLRPAAEGPQQRGDRRCRHRARRRPWPTSSATPRTACSSRGRSPRRR